MSVVVSRRRPERRSSEAPLLALALVALAGCQPFASEGERCDDTPCALGLVCVDGACEVPEAPDAGPAPCEADDECVIQGNSDGRACVDGACVWAECAFDAQCGTRVCDQGECAVREACASDDDCDEGDVCDESACRTACADDDACTGLFEACSDDGRCRQQCFTDLLCFGGLCDDGVCTDPQCAVDEDCEEPGDWFCNDGRCESFLPCDDDGDCFDPAFRCNELGRCEERPLCTRDDECGLEAVCIDAHCRPTESCLVDEDACGAGRECVAGRCVTEPGCRANADCSDGEVCVRGSCRDETLSDAAEVVAESALGACGGDSEGVCHLALFVGEEARLRFGALDGDGAPVLAAVDARVQGPATITLSSVTRDGASVSAVTAGSDGVLEVFAGDVFTLLPVTVVGAAPAGALHVLVIDEGTGAPVPGATVTAAGASATSDEHGLAVFAPAPSSEPALVSARLGARGVAVADVVPSGALRLPLPVLVGEPVAVAAGFTARVVSSGDEIGPVGIGLALPSLERLSSVRASSLFGPPYVGSLDVPILGAIPLALPAVATLQASLPLVGDVSDVRPLAYAVTAPGPRAVTAFEGRYETDALFGLTGAGDEVELLLDLAAGAEGMDVLTAHAGVLATAPLVPDAADVDGDGDSSELVPDFEAFPSVEVTPTARPGERVGVLLGPAPAGARTRVLATAGLLPVGYGFVPTGLAAFSLDDGAPRQLKAAAPGADGLTSARRALVVEALFDDGRESRLQHVAGAFAPAVDLGSFLEPPVGVTFLDGVPLPGDRLLLLPEAPGATTFRVILDGDGARWHVYLPAGQGGRSVTVDDTLGGLSATLVAVEALRFDDEGATSPTHERFTAGSGPAAPAEEAARALARAP